MCILFHSLNRYIFSIYYVPRAMNSAGDPHRTKQILSSECDFYGEKHNKQRKLLCFTITEKKLFHKGVNACLYIKRQQISKTYMRKIVTHSRET